MRKILLITFFIILAGFLIIAADGDQTQFGNSTTTTCWVGGTLGNINCTGEICTNGGNCLSDITAGDGYPKDQAVNTTSDVRHNSINISGTILNESGLYFNNSFSIVKI